MEIIRIDLNGFSLKFLKAKSVYFFVKRIYSFIENCTSNQQNSENEIKNNLYINFQKMKKLKNFKKTFTKHCHYIIITL